MVPFGSTHILVSSDLKIWRPSNKISETLENRPVGWKDTPWDLLNFSYEDFDIKDKQKIKFLELGDVHVPVCLNFWANHFWEQETILKNCLGIDNS